MRSNFVAILDANVLFPAPLRDLLVELGSAGLYRARWTDQITEEWVRNALEKLDHLEDTHLRRTVELMERAIPGCIVTGYEPSIALIEGLPDHGDRHVLAAAIKCSAQVIVTYNLKDFPPNILEQFDVEAKHPDEFLQDTYDIAPAAFVACVKRIRRRLVAPHVQPQELIGTYRDKHELTLTASTLEQDISLID